MLSNYDDTEVSFDIVESIGVLTTYSTGWTREINLVSWNGGPARYDIRDWDPNHERMSKGLTLQEKEMRILVDSFKKRRSSTRFSNAPQEPLEDKDTETVDEAEDI